MAPLPRRWRGAFPWAVILERRTNDGFAKGINAGAASGHAPFLLLLNPDCVAGTDFVARLVDFAVAHPDAAIVGPRILNADGTIQGSARRFPGWSTFIAGRSSWLTRKFPNNPLSRWNLPALAEGAGDVACRLGVGRVHARAPRRRSTRQAAWTSASSSIGKMPTCASGSTSSAGARSIFRTRKSCTPGGRSSVHAYRESLAAFHASALKLFRKHARWPARWLAPLLYVALQARLRTLLYVHRDRLRTARLPQRERSSHV